MKLGIAQFRQWVRDNKIEENQLSISEGGGIFCVKVDIDSVEYSCEITARDEKNAKRNLGF